MWMSGHEGIAGNEDAASLANNGKQYNLFSGPELHSVVLKCYLTEMIRL